jgi:predicted metal-dependent peptidase
LGWQFVELTRQPAIPSRVQEELKTLWRYVEIELDYEGLANNGLMVIDPQWVIRVQPYKQASSQEWVLHLTHLLYHLAFDFIQPPCDHPNPALWRYACECLINYRIGDVPFTQLPAGFPTLPANRNPFRRLNGGQRQQIPKPERLIAEWRNERQLPRALEFTSPAGDNHWDVLAQPEGQNPFHSLFVWNYVQNLKPQSPRQPYADGKITRAYHWVAHYFPLLSAITSEFKLDYDHAAAYNIALGAVAAQEQTLFVNPQAPLSELEWRWVLVHEILHVVLEHHQRRGERDALLWNVACDYVINNWLEQMGVGMRPDGVLYKAEYVGRDAESIYDELLHNGGNDQLKVTTFRGDGLSDILDFDQDFRQENPAPKRNPFGRFRNGVRQMTQANAKRLVQEDQEQHEGQYMGDLPGDLIEQLELGGLLTEQISIPDWKVELAQWLDWQLAPRGMARSYSRLNRRQSASPGIPLAGKARSGFHSPTYGVILDTSGSMSHPLLQKGLAAVVAYSQAQGVSQIRMVMCDTRPFDEGYIPLEKLQKPYHIYGRGGTTLQPAIDLLESASDFPDDAPILIVTDGAIDVLTISRDHAFLLPGNGKLPFEPQGPIFRILGNNPSPFGRLNNNAPPTPPTKN